MILKVRSLESVRFLRYLSLCNVLCTCNIRAIPTYTAIIRGISFLGLHFGTLVLCWWLWFIFFPSIPALRHIIDRVSCVVCVSSIGTAVCQGSQELLAWQIVDRHRIFLKASFGSLLKYLFKMLTGHFSWASGHAYTGTTLIGTSNFFERSILSFGDVFVINVLIRIFHSL